MANLSTDEEKIQELLTRTVEEVIDFEHLKKRLLKGEKLRVKLGIDPTSPNIHIGRAVPLWKLKEFQDLGHKAIFIVGDFTGLVGDSSDKESERPMLTETQIKANMKTYTEQAFKILDSKKTEVHYNSKWLRKLGFMEVAKMANLFGLHEFESREVIARRLKAGKRVSYHELLYPLMQGFDSVAVKADVELGGVDQRFNLLTGRTLQKFYGQEPQDIMTLKYLVGSDGRKMSSSWGNVINITDQPDDMFGKVMALDDGLVVKYLKLATGVNLSEIKAIDRELKNGANPRDAKKRLAFEITKMYHGLKSAEAAGEEFDRVFREGGVPQNIPEFELKEEKINIADLLLKTGLARSASEAKRLIKQKAVRVGGEVVDDWHREIELFDGLIINLGPRRFARIKR